MPRRDLPPLDTLPAFAAAARHLSFTRAAAELHLTQSAVSRQIQALEASLGVALFERRHRTLALTSAGAAFAAAVGNALAAMRDATAQARSGTRDESLTVATTISFASLWLVPRLAAFQRAHPGIDLRIAADNRVQDLEREGLDLALRYATKATAGALAERLFGERVLPVASPKLVPRAMREAGEILRYPLLHYEDPQFDWPWLSWRVWCEAARVDFAATRSAAHYSHYDQVIAAAVAGQGIALGRTGLVDEWLHDGRLVAPLGKRYAADLSRERAYYLVVNPRARDRAPVVAFRAWLATQIPKGEGSP